jgi:hypothetical protein
VVRANLKLRVSARTAVGEKPSMARLEPARPAALTLKNCLRFMSIDGPLHSSNLPGHDLTLPCTPRWHWLELEFVLVSIVLKRIRVQRATGSIAGLRLGALGKNNLVRAGSCCDATGD